MKQGPSRIILPDLRLGHVIEEQDVEVGVPSRDAAYALLERIGEMNKAKFLPLIERIFDEFDRPGEVIRIDRIELDLGRFAEGDLGAVEERLASALRAELRRLIPPRLESGAAGDRSRGGASARSTSATLVEAFLHYLLHGTWPYGTALDLATAPADLLARLIADEPAALVAMLRRHGRSDAVLGRLVRQMPSDLLERLLGVLEPEDAAWILVYMEETKASHAEEPLIDESPDEFEALLWTIVLRDALNRAGLRANRRAFLRSLIAGIAEAGGLSYAELLAQIVRGLAAVPGEGRGAGSLLSVIEELGAEQRGSARPLMPFAYAAAMLEGGAEAEKWARRRRDAAGPGERQASRRASDLGRAEAKALAESLRAHRPQARWLLRRMLERDAEALLERLDGVLGAEELAHLLLPEAKARETAALLRKARTRRDAARLLAAAGDAARGETGPKEGEKASASPLARLERLLERGPAGEPELWAIVLPRAIAAAAAEDATGLRRSMRRFAMSDAARFIERISLGAGPSAVFSLLLPAPGAEAVAATIEAASCSPEESARLVAIVAALPVSASPETLVRESLFALARLRGMRAAMLAAELAAKAEQAGGSGTREPARLFEAIAKAEAMPEDAPELRRARAVDALRALLHAPGAPVRPDLAGLLAGPAVMSPAMLRDRLGASTLDPKSAAAALGRLDDRFLLRLIAWLAPREPGLRATLRRRLAGASGGAALAAIDAERNLREALRGRLAGTLRSAELAAIAAELLVTGKVGTTAARDRPPAAETVAAAELTASSQLVEQALARTGGASRGTELHRALALLAKRRPAELIRLLGEAPPGAPGMETLLAEPAALALLMKRQPALLIRLLAQTRPDLPGAARILVEPAFMAVAAAGLSPGEREAAASLAALLAGPKGRSALPVEKAAIALAAAAGQMAARREPGGFAALWLREMLRSASLSEQARLRRLLGESWPDEPRHAGMRSILGLTATKPDAGVEDNAKAGSRGPASTPSPGGQIGGEKSLGQDEDRGGSAGAADDQGRGGPRRLPDRKEAAQGKPIPPEGARDQQTALSAAPGTARGEGASAFEAGSLAWLVRMLRERPSGYERMLRFLLRSPGAAGRLASALPESLLVRLLAAVGPTEGRALLQAAELIALTLDAGGGSLARAALWEQVLEMAARGGGVGMLIERLLGDRPTAGLRRPAGRQGWTEMEARLAALAAARGHGPLRTALEERAYDRRRKMKGASGESPADRRKPKEERREERKLWDGADEESGLRVAIANAGLVLVSPYLPTFFTRLGLLDPKDETGAKWRSRKARDRAIHLLQYLVEERCDRPEPMLALNKLLCGQMLGQPVSAGIEPSEEEKETCHSLLEAVLAHWPALRESSVEALRQTFLQREGCIVRIEAGWRVDVERRVLDVLTDSIPWGFSMILHPWMKEPISVSW